MEKQSSWQLAKSSFIFLKDNFKTYWDIACPYLPILFLLSLALYYTSLHDQYGIYQDIKDTNSFDFKAYFNPENTSLSTIISVITTLITVPMATAIAIAWHRVVIIGPDTDYKVDLKKMTPPEWSFLKMAYLLALIWVPFSLGFYYLPSGLASYGAMAVVYLIVIIFALKVFPYFPAKALGFENVDWKDALSASKGHVWKLIFANLIFILLAGILMGICVGIWALAIGSVLPSEYPAEFNNYEFMVMAITNFIPQFFFTWLLTVPIGITIVSKLFKRIMVEKGLSTPRRP